MKQYSTHWRLKTSVPNTNVSSCAACGPSSRRAQRLRVTYSVLGKRLRKPSRLGLCQLSAVRQGLLEGLSVLLLHTIRNAPIVDVGFVQHTDVHHVDVLQVLQTGLDVLLSVPRILLEPVIFHSLFFWLPP